jgi:hypothetical protein
MKKIINATIFQCEFCNKISYSAGGMRLHEISCKKNPINLTPCASCYNCVKTSVLISDQHYRVGDLEINVGDKIYPDFLRKYEEERTTYYGEFEGYDLKYHRETTFICAIDCLRMYHNKVNRLSKEKAKLIKSKCDKQMPTECKNYMRK